MLVERLIEAVNIVVLSSGPRARRLRAQDVASLQVNRQRYSLGSLGIGFKYRLQLQIRLGSARGPLAILGASFARNDCA